MNFVLNSICGTIIGTYTSKKLIEYCTKKQEPKYNCIFLYNQALENTDPSKPLSYLNFFIEFVNEAKVSLDICFFLITDSKVVNSLIEAKNRNIQVRIITDYKNGIVENFHARQLFKQGLKIYFDMCEPNKCLMHHKFAIRDNSTVLQASVNLTERASIGSYDNVIITEDPEFLIPFKEHFQELVDLLK